LRLAPSRCEASPSGLLPPALARLMGEQAIPHAGSFHPARQHQLSWRTTFRRTSSTCSPVQANGPMGQWATVWPNARPPPTPPVIPGKPPVRLHPRSSASSAVSLVRTALPGPALPIVPAGAATDRPTWHITLHPQVTVRQALAPARRASCQNFARAHSPPAFAGLAPPPSRLLPVERIVQGGAM